MNNSVIDLLHCQQRMQSDTTHVLQINHQSKQEHVNDPVIDDIPTFDGKPVLNFDWILKLENKAAVTKQNP